MKQRTPFSLLMIGLLALGAGTLGCSKQEGVTRHKVSGKVTLNGTPAPVFDLSFQPDTAQGSTGPGATASGKDGVYETRPDRGLTAGPHVVDIVAFDGVATSESRDGTPLTPKPFRTTVVIPAEDSEQNFDVPASHLSK